MTFNYSRASTQSLCIHGVFTQQKVQSLDSPVLLEVCQSVKEPTTKEWVICLFKLLGGVKETYQAEFPPMELNKNDYSCLKTLNPTSLKIMTEGASLRAKDAFSEGHSRHIKRFWKSENCTVLSRQLCGTFIETGFLRNGFCLFS